MSSSSRWSGGTGHEELEKLLILNSNRLRTFVNAHLEIVTFVEAKLGLRIRDSKPSETGSSRTRCSKGCRRDQFSSIWHGNKVIKSTRWSVSNAVELMFRETAMFTSPHAKAMARKAAKQVMVQEC